MLSAAPTILAIASPPGRSMRGIIRISGDQALALVQPHLTKDTYAPEAASDERAQAPPPRLTADPSEEDGGRRISTTRPARGAFRGTLTLSAPPFSVWALAFPAPHSYTGENSIELQLPGNPALLERAIDHFLHSAKQRDINARRAEPGEFTARAYLNGRLSLTQAEGVAATIGAESDAGLEAARMLVSGRLGDFAHALANDLAGALALVEAGIDFTDQEDVVAIAPADLHARLASLRDRLGDQLAHAVGMEQLRAIPWVVLVGPPNAGKSALFNALVGRERAVVSGTAGTTRDVLAEPLAIDTQHGRAEVMLVDLAGFDAADTSAIGRQMQAAARQAIDRAELRVRCEPAEEETSKRPNVKTSKVPADEIVVRTKCDLDVAGQSSIVNRRSSIPTSQSVSAVTGEGLDRLRSAIADRLAGRAVSLAAGALALQPRHEQAMRSALANLAEAMIALEPHHRERSLANAEIIASSMRAALDDLASLAGDVTPDDILGRIFATFCVGK